MFLEKANNLNTPVRGPFTLLDLSSLRGKNAFLAVVAHPIFKDNLSLRGL